jgi:hypothetical protein
VGGCDGKIPDCWYASPSANQAHQPFGDEDHHGSDDQTERCCVVVQELSPATSPTNSMRHAPRRGPNTVALPPRSIITNT